MTPQPVALFRLILISALCCLATVDPAAADDTWQGETTAGINLRQSPSISANVITALPTGQALTVLATRNEWLQVAVDGDGYGFRGWVYATYVRRLAPPVPVSEPPLPSAAPVAVVVSPAPPQALQDSVPIDPVDPDPPALAAVKPAKEMAREMAGQTFGKTVAENPAAAPEAPPLNKTAQPALAPPEPVAKPASSATQDQAPPSSPGWPAYLELLLRLATTLLAATALLIAMRAYRIASNPALAPGRSHPRRNPGTAPHA